MKKIKKLLFYLLRISGMPYFIREFVQKNKVTILLFHEMNEKESDLIFKTLKEKYAIISLNQFLEARRKGSLVILPKKSVIITFDDGLISNYGILPEIKTNNISVTIFLCTSVINTNRHFWFNQKHPSISKKELKQISNHKRLEFLAELDFFQDKEFKSPEAINSGQIREMKAFVDFQPHTMYHPILTMCSDEEAKAEIFNSKQLLEKEYGINVKSFSYPNGNYSDREIELCKKAGYDCAITVDFGYNDLTTDLYKLKRLPIDTTNDINELLVKASGLSEMLGVLVGNKPKSKHMKVKIN